MSLADVQQFTAERMEQIVSCFKPGARITVLVRFDGQPDCDFMMTDDDLAEAIHMLHRRQAAGMDAGLGQPGGSNG